MTTERRVHLLAWLTAAVLLALFARTWVTARDQQARAEAQDTAARQVIAAKDAAIADRDKDAAGYVAQMSAMAADVRTPQQAAQVILRYLPTPAPAAGGAPPPQTAPVVVTRAELPAATAAQLPDAPGYTVLTDRQAEDIARNELSCDADRHTLAACQADTADLRTELAAAQADTEAWKRAARGGSKWQRFGRVVRSVACAGAGAGIGAAVRHDAPSAALGAGAAVAACSAF